uniref:Uncharacterized protein n=1 Tax=Caenorhabditis japonica TaxID=281687 RepID=A0A8R1DPL0_CAEJA
MGAVGSRPKGVATRSDFTSNPGYPSPRPPTNLIPLQSRQQLHHIRHNPHLLSAHDPASECDISFTQLHQVELERQRAVKERKALSRAVEEELDLSLDMCPPKRPEKPGLKHAVTDEDSEAKPDPTQSEKSFDSNQEEGTNAEFDPPQKSLPEFNQKEAGDPDDEQNPVLAVDDISQIPDQVDGLWIPHRQERHPFAEYYEQKEDDGRPQHRLRCLIANVSIRHVHSFRMASLLWARKIQPFTRKSSQMTVQTFRRTPAQTPGSYTRPASQWLPTSRAVATRGTNVQGVSPTTEPTSSLQTRSQASSSVPSSQASHGSQCLRQQKSLCSAVHTSQPSTAPTSRFRGHGVRLGISATIPLGHKHLDLGSYIATIHETTAHAKGRVAKFFLNTPSGPPQQASWQRDTTFTIETSDGESNQCKVLSMNHFPQHIAISARSVSARELDDITGAEVFITQPQDFAIADFAIAYHWLPALFGGRKVTTTNSRGLSVIFPRLPFLPTGEQKRYVRLYCDPELPAIVCGAAFGTGKTPTAMLATIVMANIEDPADRPLQLVITPTNAAAANAAKALKKLDPANYCKSLRIISTQNRGRQHYTTHTEYDYTSVLGEVFWIFVRNYDQAHPHEKIEDEMILSAVFYARALHSGRTTSSLLRNSSLKKHVQAGPLPMGTVILHVYKTKVILGATASVLDSFVRGDFRSETTKVRTVIIEEASQVPRHIFVALANILPDACLGRGFETTQATLNTSNAATIEDTRHRKPFGRYQQEPTVPGRTAQECFPLSGYGHQSSWDDLLQPNSSRHSKPRRLTVGIRWDYHKAQASLVSEMLEQRDVHVGTVDGSQGKEYDVSIVLASTTSQMSDCLLDRNRVKEAGRNTEPWKSALASSEDTTISEKDARLRLHLPPERKKPSEERH